MSALLQFFSSSFVNPALLAGASAISIPILIWLVNRYRTKTVEWAAIEFLRRAVEKTRSRLRLEELLLLLIRCLILILLAMAVARPRGKALLTSSESARKNVVMILDTSYSAGYQLGSTESDTVFQRARTQAKELISRMSRKDRLVLGFLNDRCQILTDTPRAMDAGGKIDALRTLEDPEFTVSARGTDAAAMMHRLPGVLEKFATDAAAEKTAPSLKTVFFLTDAQRSAFFDKDKLRDPSLTVVAEKIARLGGELVIVDCGDPKPANIAITSVSTRDPVVGVGLPCRFDVTVRNHDENPVTGLNLEYYIDNLETPVKRVALSLKAGETQRMPAFPYEFAEPGPHRFQVRFSSDKLVIDNSRSLVVDVREAVRVLLVNGDPQTGSRRRDDEVFFINRALTPFDGDSTATSLIRTRTTTEGTLGEEKLEDYDLILAANVATFSDVSVARLETYVRDGGVVLFTMGELINESFYNQRLYRDGAGIFPVRLGEKVGRADSESGATGDAPEWELEINDRSWPGIKRWLEEDFRKRLKAPPIYRIQKTEPAAPEKIESRVIMTFQPRAKLAGSEDGAAPTVNATPSPAFVEKPFGRGVSLAFLSTVDAGWNKAVVYDVFYVLFWRGVALHLSQTTAAPRQLGIGDTYEDTLRQDEYSREVRILRPDGQPTIQAPREIKGEEARFRLSFDNTEMPGVYTVELSDLPSKPRTYFAVNVDASEGDPMRLAADDLKEALPGLKVKQLTVDALREVVSGSGRGAGANEYWRSVIYAVLALMLLESTLAMLFGRRRQ